MPYGECKIYNDGSHYIAIPHATRPSLRRAKPPEEIITVKDYASVRDKSSEAHENAPPTDGVPLTNEDVSKEDMPQTDTAHKERRMTRKELFDELYAKTVGMPRNERKAYITEEMTAYFKDAALARQFVEQHFERKLRNLICRRIRLIRKVNLQEFNYFCTFTYDDKKHTEESFRKKLRNTLSHFCSRKDWRYVGVWERSPEKQRLHFHGLFYIPEGTMPGNISEVNSYSFADRSRQITLQNSYFLKEFGRNDFEDITDNRRVGDAIAYITKYMEKSGEKIVYSRGLHTYFISDITDEDIVCNIGTDDRKLLLYDDFVCIDEGVLIGKVSKEVIRKMRKCN